MFKFLNQGHKLMRIQSGIIAITTLAVLAAVITTLALSSFTAEAQGNQGAVANLQLTSTSAGTLTVSWDAASPVPTDYRIDWAKSGEDYKSWKVDDGHVYTAETATTTTITDLSHDTEYKIRMRARYYRGEHEGKSWGGPWAEATITVAGEPAETPTPEPVQEEEESTTEAGAIDTLTATDDATGQLVLTWGSPAAPNATPTDYHVNWAKSSEDYPADTAEAGNAHPDSTTHTLAGLEYDSDYKIRVRARYTDGENTDSPWNGPWTETTAQVKLPLPMTPNMTGAAVSPASQVYLFWSEPSNDSITGYQILRGPDADNLAIIEDDTGSSSTSYTDTAPPAGQTHTYAVKARNDSGLSPLSNTLTATVPAAREEQALIVARHEDGERALVSNLGQTVHSDGVIAGLYLFRTREHAVAFTTGDNPFGYHVTSAQLSLKQLPGEDTPTPDVSIRADDAGIPGDTVLYTLTTSTTITSSWNLVTFTTTDNSTLRPNTTYWLYTNTTGTNYMFVRGTESNAEDIGSNADWRIDDDKYYSNHGAPWARNTDFTLRIAINGHAAPAFLVSNLDESPIISQPIQAQNVASTANLAQSFRANNNPDSSSTEFDFHGITLLLDAPGDSPRELTASDLIVTVHSDTSGEPGDLVYTLTPPSSPYTVLGDGNPVTFMAPTGSTLSSGVTYWLKLEAAAASTYFSDAYISIGRTNLGDEVQGHTTNNQWSIGDDSLKSQQILRWQTQQTTSIRMKVLGSQRYDTLVSNIDQPSFTGTQSVSIGLKAAQSFHTPSGPLGQQYRFSSVRIIASSQNPTQATVDLHADDNGAPGDHLASFTTPGDFAPGLRAKDDFIGVAPRDILLNTDTRYWIVFSNADNFTTFRIGITRSETEDLTSLDGWTIGDSRVKKVPDRPWDELYDPIQMELLGTPFIRTNEADGPDLPGAGHNAHQTGAVVIPGIVSTGHLTAGLDYDHGHTGDYWWLETQRGHSYRVEVKFGDNPNNDTGGSAWMSFIDPDHDDYPYASGCCEADHNRDDGHTFVHFYRPTDDWNNQYLINVAAFDKLNTGSSTYNGPYTITMTDVTDIKKVATNLYKGTRTNLLNVHSTRQYAVPFTTGPNPDGYRLDRIRTHILTNGSPALSLYSNTSGAPNAEVCAFKNPTAVEQHVMWSDGPPAITFLAPDCHDDVLIADTTYWIVLDGTNYTPLTTDSDQQDGWAIGNVNAVKNSGSWSNLSSGTIPVEIWASER